MEDMDIDQVVEIPDTPDRLSSRQVNHENICGKEPLVSMAGHLRNYSSTGEECPEQLHNGTGLGIENGRSRKLCTRPKISPIKIDECKRKTNNMSENSHAPQNTNLFRRKMLGRNSKNEERLNKRAEHLEKGEKMCIEVPHQSSFLQCAPNFVMTNSTSYKGKEKVADHSVKGPGTVIDHGKQNDHMNYSPHKHAKEISMPAPTAISVGAGGRKRLVRNGCISPHNIATKARQDSECNRTSRGNVVNHNAGNEICHSPPCSVDINDIIADDKDSERVHRRIAHQPSTARNHDGMPCSSAKEDTCAAAGHAGKNALRCFGEIGGWRSTRNHSKNIDSTMPDADLYLSRSNNISGWSADSHGKEQTGNGSETSNTNCTNSRNHVAQSASWLLSNSDQMTGTSHASNTVVKKQKKHGAICENRGESSTSVPEDSNTLSINSTRMSRNSRLSGLRSSRTLHPVIEIDDMSPVMRWSNSQNLEWVENDDTIERVRQIEADEMLARELQEQLYYEEPASLGGEVDEHIARALQQEEESTNAASRRRRVSRPRAPSMAHPHRQRPIQPARNASNRRGAQPRAPSSSRMAQLRDRFRRQSWGGSLLEFPLDMDLDMRIDILEALEAAVGDLDTRLDNHILQYQRDFNENDYEMLLALDENNHHVGASGNQINNLPVSTVQTENSDETCAICLETPSVGDTIRHLPCLHKFHKDCIDPWLSRRTSCPVCKSSIT